MTRQQIIFLVAGFIAGSVTVAAGRVSLWVLTVGVGPLFFLAILAAIAFTGSWPHIHGGFWRYVLAGCTSTIAYVLAFITFWWLGGYLQRLLGTNGSNDLSEFRLDMWVASVQPRCSWIQIRRRKRHVQPQFAGTIRHLRTKVPRLLT